MGVFYKESFTARKIHRRFKKCEDGLWRIEVTSPIGSFYLKNRANKEYIGRTLAEVRAKYQRNA